jgi:preprotein translocase subunit SecD
VTDSLTNVLKTFDSEGSAVTSSLKISPDLAFKAKVFAGSSVPGNSGEITVILVLNDQDAPKLKELTENNFGKRTLLVCRNKVIAAPAISEPITSKQLKFNVKDPMALDSLRSGIK